MSGLLAAAAYLLAGLGLLEHVPALSRRSLPFRLGAGYVAGVAFVAGSSYALSHAGVPLGRALTLALVVLPAAGLLRRPGRAGAPRRPFETASLLPLAAGFLVAAGVLAEAVTNPTQDWDGRVVWNAHARIVRAAGSVDAPMLRDGRYAVEVPRHPLLMPLAQAGATWMGADPADERTVRPLYALFLPAFLLVLYGEARRRAGAVPAALVTTLAALTPQLALDRDGGASGSYSDLPLACFLGLGALLLFGRVRSARDGALAGLLLAAAILTKDEGLPLALLVLLAAALRPARMAMRGGGAGLGPWRPLVPVLAFVAFAMALVLSWKAGIESRLEPNFGAFPGLAALARQALSRAGLVLLGVFDESVRPEAWRGVTWACAFALAAGAGGLLRPRARPIALSLLGAMGLYAATYGVTRLAPEALIRVTFRRFLTQVALLVFVLVALALRDLLRRRGPRSRAGSAARALAVAALLAISPVAEALGIRLLPVERPPARSLESYLPVVHPVPPWWRELPDAQIPAAFDEPAEGASVRGPLALRGWAEDVAGPAELVEITVDGLEVSALSVARRPRPDVASAFPRLGACARSGWEISLAPLPPGPHALRVTVLSGAGSVRRLERRVVAAP